MKILLRCLALLAVVQGLAAAEDSSCAKYLTPSHQRDVFRPEWEKRASKEAKMFMAAYVSKEAPAAALEMQCLLTVGLERVIKNENDTTVQWFRDHKNVRPSKGQEDLDAAAAALREFRKGRNPGTFSASDQTRLKELQAKVREAQSQLSRYKGLCNEWTQSVCSAYVFPAKYHNVRWVEIRWEGRDVNEATHNMVALCPKDVEDPFAHRDRCLLIDAWRNLDPDRDVYGFSEYHNMGVSRSQKTCPDGKTLAN